MMSTTRILGVAALVICSSVVAISNDVAPADKHDRSKVEARIEQLIQQLGDDDYAAREEAQAELTKVGLDAFDALHEAQWHDDIEISWRAKYLIRSMRIGFVREDDPPQVKSILEDYHGHSAVERRGRIERLAHLPENEGVEALCRLVRFERSLRLSKEAALCVMQRPMPEGDQTRRKLADQIRLGMGLSQRAAADWLRTHADRLDSPTDTLTAWRKHLDREQDQFSFLPEQSSRQIVRDLLKYQAELLSEVGKPDEAQTAMLQWASFGDQSRADLIETFDWLTRQKAWSVVDQVAALQAGKIRDDAELLYILSFAHLERGQAEQAEAVANQALAINPDDAKEHSRLGEVLQDRGLLKWARREYRHVIDSATGAASSEYVGAVLSLAELLFDQESEKDAADLLSDLVDKMNEDAAVRQVVQRRRDPASVTSRMHYFHAAHHGRKGERNQQKQRLAQAIEADSTDVDVLIAMHQLPDADKAWREKTAALIRVATENARGRIRQGENYRKLAAGANDADQRDRIEQYMAVVYNEFAWLVGNTIGDVDEAIRLSHKSLEIMPDNGGFFDTLAHCYHRKGDFESAVKYQRMAIELEPHSGIIRRKLELFEQSLAESKEAEE
jgi:tetratricopeptide (TPR) repeat protein